MSLQPISSRPRKVEKRDDDGDLSALPELPRLGATSEACFLSTALGGLYYTRCQRLKEKIECKATAPRLDHLTEDRAIDPKNGCRHSSCPRPSRPSYATQLFPFVPPFLSPSSSF